MNNFKSNFFIVISVMHFLTFNSTLSSGFSQDKTLKNTLILPEIFKDSMVLQRGQPLLFWGKSLPGNKVIISFGHEIKSTIAKGNGDWSLNLHALKAGGPYQLKVSDNIGNRLSLKGVLIGDVWLCAGQSNMNFMLAADKSGSAELATLNNQNIREFRCPMPEGVDNPENNDHSQWISAVGKKAGKFSAVAFYFAKKIEETEHIPIGIIVMACGDTRAESWMPEESIAAEPRLNTLNSFWLLHKNDNSIPVNHRPGLFYNSVVKPVLPYTIKGVVWYQGESNTLPDNSGRSIFERALEYKALLKTLITDWRNSWKNSKLPFYIVQLPNYKDSAVNLHWSTIRQAQLESMQEVPKVGMAVTIDVGSAKNIHPDNKEPVGYRIALWALANQYADKNKIISGPVIQNLKTIKGNIILNFKYTGAGLISQPSHSLEGFEIADALKPSVFIPVKALIEGNTVVVMAKLIQHPVSIRYAWSDNPNPSLFNKEGLPASPFLIKEE